MAYDPTRQVPPQGYPAQPFTGPGQTAPGYPPGYAPQQFAPPGYPSQPPVIPSYAAYASQPVAPGATGSFWVNLGLPGQGALLSGLALLVFFFLPWLSTPDFNNSREFTSTFVPLITSSGFTTAGGISINAGGTIPTLNFNLFPSLWVVPLGALGLIVIAWLLGQRRITIKAASLTLFVISIAILAVTLLFLSEVNAIENVIVTGLFSSRTTLSQTLVSVSFGFWLAVIAAVVALGASGYGLFQGNKAPGGVIQ